MSKGDTVTVSREWYEYALLALSGKAGCPFCNSMREPIIHHPDSETFYPVKGCLDCDKWWERPRVKR